MEEGRGAEGQGGGGRGRDLGALFGSGTWFRHEEDAADLLLPDGIASAGAAQEEVVFALCHYNVGALHGSQLGCVGGVARGRRLEEGESNTDASVQC